MNIERIMASLEAKHPGESEYLQAVKEVLLSIEDIYNQHPSTVQRKEKEKKSENLCFIVFLFSKSRLAFHAVITGVCGVRVRGPLELWRVSSCFL